VNIFGQPVSSHGPNKIAVCIFAAMTAGSLWLIWLDLHRTGEDKTDGRADAAIHLTFAVLFATAALWISRQRLILYPDGLSYANLLGEKHVRFDDVHRFYYQATKRSINFIPIGTYYWFRLIDSQGQKIRFGSSLSQASVLADKLVVLTRGPLLKRIAAQFDSGVDVGFGPIVIGKQSGIAIKNSLGRVKHIPWNEIHSFAIQSGRICIWRAGEKRTSGTAIAKVPNAFALLSLLNIIFQSRLGYSYESHPRVP
jgi:hypothetical protein